MRTGAKFGPARDLARRLQVMFEPAEKDKKPEFDVCTIIYNTFKSAMSQVVTVKRIIPYPVEELAAPQPAAEGTVDAGYDLEPSDEQLLEALLPANLSTQLFRAMLESFASEQGARMTAMDNATRNANDMIGRLTLTYNRTRQATITKELIEIISGAEAL
jgi:F-type H+-transporting ATPase subunit gamma